MVRPRDRASQAAPCPAGIHRSPRSAAMTFAELSGYLDRLESTRSRNELVKTLAELCAKTSPEEIQPLTYLIQGRLVPFFEPVEIGLGEKLVLAAIGQAFSRPMEEVTKLFGQVGDLGLVARTFWAGGEEEVNALNVTVGRPIRSQLAERLPNPEAVIKRLGLVAVQPKYDGIRVQIHKNGSVVRVFSRNLEDYTLMFSELTAAARGLKDDTLILDGEAIAYSKELEEYLPFQLTASRRRQHGIEQAALELPLVAFVFDILYRNGRDLTDLPYEERLALVDQVIAGSTVLLPAPIIKTDSVEVLTRTLLDYISQGLEGVVVKRPDSKYQAGARNFNWVKLKRHTSGELSDTIDLVLLGYYFGKGKRAEFGVGALLAGVYDAA